MQLDVQCTIFNNNQGEKDEVLRQARIHVQSRDLWLTGLTASSDHESLPSTECGGVTLVQKYSCWHLVSPVFSACSGVIVSPHKPSPFKIIVTNALMIVTKRNTVLPNAWSSRDSVAVE